MPDQPLVRWDGLHLVLDLEALERHLAALLSRTYRLSDLVLEGRDDAIRMLATVTWKGVSSRAAIDIAEIRLKRRFLGLRMRRPRALGGLPVPRAAVEAGIRAADADGVTVFRGEGIVVVDLRRWLPSELDLTVLTVQATQRSLHIWFAPGSLKDLPRGSTLALAAGEGATIP
jgi:hypothetical protein